MKKTLLILIATIAIILAGCGKREPVITDKPVDNKEPEAKAVVEFSWDTTSVTVFETPETDDFLDASACDLSVKVAFYGDKGLGTYVKEKDGESYRYDASGKLIMKEKFEQDGKIKKYTWTIYSFDCNFDIEASPVAFVYGFASYPITEKISRPGKETLTFSGSELARRSYTGVWFFGICTCEDGRFDEWFTPSYQKQENPPV